MSDTTKKPVGPARPPKEHQFKSGKSGNPRGRPSKRLPLLVPSELRRIFLAALDEPVEVTTSRGLRKMSTFEALMPNLIASAARGNPTALNHFMRMVAPALNDRMEAHPEVWLAEFLRSELEKPGVEPGTVDRKLVSTQIKATKGKY
ncbi:MAG TPA: DUF5681 domain-containing protein [Allosphingosinicella sp.]|nr:DUF5681 domain-containing protein [Allosphingosinicella sp.]